MATPCIAPVATRPFPTPFESHGCCQLAATAWVTAREDEYTGGYNDDDFPKPPPCIDVALCAYVDQLRAMFANSRWRSEIDALGPTLACTSHGAADAQRVAFVLLDTIVREIVPAALRLIPVERPDDLDGEAKWLEDLRPVVDLGSAAEAHDMMKSFASGTMMLWPGAGEKQAIEAAYTGVAILFGIYGAAWAAVRAAGVESSIDYKVDRIAIEAATYNAVFQDAAYAVRPSDVIDSPDLVASWEAFGFGAATRAVRLVSEIASVIGGGQ